MKRLAAALIAALLPITIAAETLVYFGTDTGGQSKGIYVSTFDEATGALTPPRLAAAVGNPGFLTTHPSKPLVYSVAASRAADGSWKEEVAAFAVQEDGRLVLLNTRPSEGSGPCHLSVDASGRVLLLANYNGGNVVSYPLHDDGSLGPAASTVQHQGSSVNPQRQTHPHGIYPGPRHLAFHPNGRYAYVNLEITSRVAAYRVDAATGALEGLAVLSSLPPDVRSEGNSTAEIVAHPGGRFLLAASQNSHHVTVFRIDAERGTLSPAGHPVAIDRPTHVRFMRR